MERKVYIQGYLFIDSTKRKKQSHNLSRIIRGFEPESILIIMSRRLKHIEKRKDGLQVTHTS